MSATILVVDDDPALGDLLREGLGDAGFDVLGAASVREALASLESHPEVDAVLTDLRMPHESGLELCEHLSASRPDVPVVVMTAFGSLDTAIAAIRAGAYDFLTKPVDPEAAAITLRRAVEHRALRSELRRLRAVVDRAQGFDDLLGESPAIRRVTDLLERVAASDATVLLTGESGTGKEVVARALHRRGRRGPGPFVAVNCAALPEALLESELFGHRRGAFTDARETRPGLFLQATGGTLFLDEIGELPPGLQAKLLRALQERTVRPVGGDAEIGFDARLIAATNRDLEAAVEEKRFREDLWFRINVIHVEIPPLRARGNDVLLLAQHFVEEHSRRSGKPVVGLEPAAAERLLAYPWPGNVRELENCIERAIALTSFDRLTLGDLPERIRGHRPSRILIEAGNPEEIAPLEEIERRYVLHVLRAVGGNKTVAARRLGLDRKTLYRKLGRWSDEEA